MDAWGTGISANDTYAMVRDEFFGAYDEGAEPADITKQILEDHKDLSVDPEESHHFWFALARCQWECKALQPEVFERVRDLIESGKDIELWRRTEGVEEEDLAQREKVLKKFLEELKTEKFSVRKRKG